MTQDVVAVYVQTESGDDYLNLYADVLDTTDLIQRLKSDFDEEFTYISNIIINTEFYYSDSDIDENLIWSAIQQELE